MRCNRASLTSLLVAHVTNTRRLITPTCIFPGNIEDIPIELVPWDDPKSVPSHWNRPGVYGVYSSDGTLQFVASTADVGVSMSGHKRVIKVPELVHAVRMITVDNIEDAPLDKFAEAWVMSYHEAELPIPPGNTDEMPQWRDEPISPDVYFSGVIDAPTEEEKAKLEIENILANHKYVLFMKGTSNEPLCGFSKSVLEIMSTHLDKEAGQFVCVDCLNAERNVGLREGIKSYSSWPTIPQLYVNGDFVGGADIVSEMNQNGELASMFKS